MGAALANRLAQDNHTVRVIDNLSAGDPTRLDSRISFTRGDVADVPKLWTLLHDVDCVYHLAARVLVPESILYPSDYNAVNVGGTVAVMEAMRDAGVKRVVLTSSGAVYGEQKHQPVREDMPPHPDSPYAVSKLAAEHYVKTIGKLWGIETVILRVFNAYGPGQALPPAHAPVIPQFLQQARGGGSLVIFGDGQQTRDFIYVDDVVEALVAAATVRQVNGEIINVGSGRETSIRELALTIARLTERQVEILYSSAQSGGVARLCANPDKCRRLLGTSARTSLENGLRLTLKRDPRFKSAQENSRTRGQNIL